MQNLQKNIDDKWDDCWPVSSLRPLTILDLISYVFFIKKLDDRELINKKLRGIQDSTFVYTKEVEEFTWSRLQNMDARQIHDLFTKENGIIDLMMRYAHSDSLYSDFFKAPLLLTPTPKLLLKVIEILNIIESSDTDTQAAISDYLFNKAANTGHNGQALIPENMARLMVAIAGPAAKEVTCDPSAGNGSLAINAARYIAGTNNSPVAPFENDAAAGMLITMESDLIQLRLAAMNMLLHGIKNPVAEILDILPGGNTRLPGKPTLILSNLFFTEVEGNMRVEGDRVKPGTRGREIVLLNLILENMGHGARAVVMVPEYLLKNMTPEIKKIRQDIINNYNLEGVIYLPSKSNSLFSGAGMLIFNKHESITTDHVWFCKMKTNREGTRNEESLPNGSRNDFLASAELYEENDILNQWKNRETPEINDPGNSFYITAYDIKDNDYNLNFNDYKLIQKGRKLNKKIENTDNKENPVLATRKEHLHDFFEDTVPVLEKKPGRKILSAVILALIVLSAATGIYFFYSKNNNFPAGGPGKLADSVSNVNIGNTAVQPQPGTKNRNKSTSGRKDVLKPSLKKNNVNTPAGVSKQYTVITKAYFYSEPNTGKRRSFYLQPRKDLVLNSTNEQNGFEYVVYVNKKGETTKGWLNKQDLQPVE